MTAHASAAPAGQRPPALRIAVLAVGAAALGVYGHVCVAKGVDFPAFRDVGVAALQRGDIYARGATSQMYVFYLPHFSLVMAPFAALPSYAAGWLWFLLKVAGLVWFGRWVRDQVRLDAPGRPLPRGWPAYAALPFLLAWNPINGDFKLGQVNLLVLFLTLLAITRLARGQHLLAALLYSLALVKVTPWVFLPWLALRRQWRFLASLAAVGAGWLTALAAWFGPGRVPGLFVDWIETSRIQKMGLASTAYFENQSLQGAAARLATHLPALQQPAPGGIVAYQLLWTIPCLALFAVLLLGAARDRFRRALPPEELALACLLLLLASPDTRWAHQVQWMVPVTFVAVLAARLRLLRFVPPLREAPPPSAAIEPAARAALGRWLGAILGYGLVALVLLTRDVVGKPLDNLLRALGVQTAFMLLVTAFFVKALLDRRLASALGAPLALERRDLPAAGGADAMRGAG